MKIPIHERRYLLPLVLLPFFFLFFFVYRSLGGKNKQNAPREVRLNPTVADVSANVAKKQLQDKLDAFRSSRQLPGYPQAATSPSGSLPGFSEPGEGREQALIDSLNRVIQRHSVASQVMAAESATAMPHEVAAAVPQPGGNQVVPSEGENKSLQDPMATFRMEMAYLDSMNNAHNPAAKAALSRRAVSPAAAVPEVAAPTLTVRRTTISPAGFNTVRPAGPGGMIQVVIDEGLTGYAASRIRLRLLDDITAGSFRVSRGTYIYALIDGFSGQRVSLSVREILFGGRILPVRLDVFDIDGLPGLYVPGSAFRDFTKELGQNTMQGVGIENNGSGSPASQFVSSTASRLFQSTSSAVAALIRSNKARIKFNTYLYLVDRDAPQNSPADVSHFR